MQTLAETPSAERPVRASRKKVNYSEALLGLTKPDSDSETSEDDESSEGEEDDEEDISNKTPEGAFRTIYDIEVLYKAPVSTNKLLKALSIFTESVWDAIV